jgi:hypothetical protein
MEASGGDSPKAEVWRLKQEQQGREVGLRRLCRGVMRIGGKPYTPDGGEIDLGGERRYNYHKDGINDALKVREPWKFFSIRM